MSKTREARAIEVARCRARSGRRPPGAWLGERGASAVEMALVAPVFLLLMLGGLQFAHMMYLRHEIYAAAQQVCRQLALGADTLASAQNALQGELQRIGVAGTLEVVAPTPTTDASVEIRVPLATLLWTELFRPMVGDSATQVRVVYRSSSRTG